MDARELGALDARTAYEYLRGYLDNADPGQDSLRVLTGTLRALLDGIDLDDAPVEVPEDTSWVDNREAQLRRLKANYDDDEQKLHAVKELATQWRNETANRAMTEHDHDIKRAAALLLQILR